MYLLYLSLLILKAYSELRSMPYFGVYNTIFHSKFEFYFCYFLDMRLKFLTLLMMFVMAMSLTVTSYRFGFGILEDNFVAKLTTTYKSSAQFMCFYGLLNFYLYTMAYVYSPNGRPVHGNYQNFIIKFDTSKKLSSILFRPEPTITKDNPAFSMINDSDEDVIYGSDDESRRPLNSTASKGNDYDSD